LRRGRIDAEPPARQRVEPARFRKWVADANAGEIVAIRQVLG
jgi:hypothetical protein